MIQCSALGSLADSVFPAPLFEKLDRVRGEKVRQLIIGPVSSVVTMQFREGTRRSTAGAFLIKVKRAAPNAGGDTVSTRYVLRECNVGRWMMGARKDLR